MATSQQMSVTQGLAELKLLDKRLQKGLDGAQWCAVSTKTKLVDKERLKRNAESQYQSYCDLVKRRDAIKRAIVMSNATTRVKIGTWEGTVAEAIEHKGGIHYKKLLLQSMREQVTDVKATYANQEELLNQRLDRLLQSEVGKDVRTNPETIQTLTQTFRENNRVELLDPLDLAEKARALEEEIDLFETNVDWVLSEANGKTLISV